MKIWSHRIAENMNEKIRKILPWSLGQIFLIFHISIYLLKGQSLFHLLKNHHFLKIADFDFLEYGTQFTIFCWGELQK